jgi:transposase
MTTMLSARLSSKRASSPPSQSKKSREQPQSYDEALYKKRHKIENSFAWIKDWRNTL